MRRHADSARLEGAPPRAPAPGAARGREPLDEPVQLLLHAPGASAVRAVAGRVLLHLSHARHRRGSGARRPGPVASAATAAPAGHRLGGGYANRRMPARLQSRPWVSPASFAHGRDCRERRLRYRGARTAGAIAGGPAPPIASSGVAEPPAAPAWLRSGESRHAGGHAAHRSARARRRPCFHRVRIAADPGELEMTNEELLEMARELNRRGVAYALVTVVRAGAPTSAYPGAQAIVRADGTLHGWIGGGCAKQVVINAARSAIASGQPKLVRISN